MKTLKLYLDVLHLEDLLYGAVGGFVGALLSIYFMTATYETVPILTLAGSIVSAIIVADKRLKNEPK